ncbi:hypothetical protein GCM10023074_52350 [Microbispora amethystogenes]|uniref:DUF320 domain-containing protein n=2 Tax=Microbispora amethystogenes TaxID=1427754 RepID=A0ABQ4FGQ9_9ACTN|nr:hypothetical protein Mam01_41640 [Microbispora amethystogenes]
MSDRARRFPGPTTTPWQPPPTKITGPSTGPVADSITGQSTDLIVGPGTGSITGSIAAGLVAAGLIVISLPLLSVPAAGAAPVPPSLRSARHAHARAHGNDHGNDHGGGHGRGATQSTGGTGTSNSPSIGSPARQVATGRRNVNAPAANSAVTFAGIQQVSSVSVFTNTVNGNCRRGINRCVINQTLRAVEGRGGHAHAG